jgi:hypothetical protein
MANIYDWSEQTEPISYAPTVWTAFGPMDGMSYAEDPMNLASLRDTDGNDNMPPTWFPIDPSLKTTMNASAPAIPIQNTTTILEDLVESNKQILLCLTQLLETSRRPTAPDRPATEPMFTDEELKMFAPIPEEESESAIPSIINGLCVNANPRATEIECIIDSKRIPPDHQTFFLAKTTRNTYYWFHSPYADRDHSFHELIGEFRRNARDRAAQRRTGSVKELRSGRMVGM